MAVCRRTLTPAVTTAFFLCSVLVGMAVSSPPDINAKNAQIAHCVSSLTFLCCRLSEISRGGSARIETRMSEALLTSRSWLPVLGSPYFNGQQGPISIRSTTTVHSATFHRVAPFTPSNGQERQRRMHACMQVGVDGLVVHQRAFAWAWVSCSCYLACHIHIGQIRSQPHTKNPPNLPGTRESPA